MIVTKLIGGLGNQMFQYAVGRQLAVLRKTLLKLDLSGFDNYTLREYLLDRFNIQAEPADEQDLSKMNSLCEEAAVKAGKLNPFSKPAARYFKESRRSYFRFQKKVLQLPADSYLDGYWVHPRYFSGIRNELLREFSSKAPMNSRSQAVLQKMRGSESCSVHIRRGDYVTDPRTMRYHGVLSPDYYRAAVRRITERSPNACFYLFSDDLDWVRENLNLEQQHVLVDTNVGESPHFDMMMMAECKHHIIANSTFSWWAAWLSTHPESMVIAPAQWTVKVSASRIALPSWQLL